MGPQPGLLPQEAAHLVRKGRLAGVPRLRSASIIRTLFGTEHSGHGRSG